MINKNMNLREMIAYRPSEMDMLSLPLDVVTYLKIAVVSGNIEDNYAFIRFLFEDDEVKEYFKEHEKTLFIDFNASRSKPERYITFFELFCKMPYSSVSIYLEERMAKYDAKGDVIIDFFTHDDHFYRLSVLGGVLSLEEVPTKTA